MSYTRQWLGLIGLLCVLVLFGPSTWAAEVYSGIKGKVLLYNPYVATRTPVVCSSNVLVATSGSTNLFQASFRVYNARTGKFITSVTTHKLGHFRVSLATGRYRVVPETMRGGQVLQPGMIVIGNTQWAPPFNVTVRPYRFTAVTVTYREMMGF
jgi:hypothetical protein